MTKTIRQTVTLGAPPRRVYEALIDGKRHAKFTCAEAAISRKAGGAFTCYGGYITGFTLELVPGKRIVQAWRAKGWPKGTYSIVTFALTAVRGARTKVSFTHEAVPAASVAHLSRGWRLHYWTPLKAYLET